MNAQMDAATIALAVLGWILSDDDRAGRFLSLTGLTPDRLRAGVSDPAVLAAAIAFLEGHEPDLIAAAQALSLSPQDLVNAGGKLA